MYFYYRYLYINYVYILINKKENTLLLTTQVFCVYVKTRWDLKVCIFYRNNKPLYGNRWDAWILEEGIIEYTLLPNTHD